MSTGRVGFPDAHVDEEAESTQSTPAPSPVFALLKKQASLGRTPCFDFELVAAESAHVGLAAAMHKRAHVPESPTARWVRGGNFVAQEVLPLPPPEGARVATAEARADPLSPPSPRDLAEIVLDGMVWTNGMDAVGKDDQMALHELSKTVRIMIRVGVEPDEAKAFINSVGQVSTGEHAYTQGLALPRHVPSVPSRCPAVRRSIFTRTFTLAHIYTRIFFTRPHVHSHIFTRTSFTRTFCASIMAGRTGNSPVLSIKRSLLSSTGMVFVYMRDTTLFIHHFC